MSNSQRFIDAFWELCREHRHHLVCIYPDMYLADEWDLDDENDLSSLHIITAEEHAEMVQSRIRGDLKSRIADCAWWDRPGDTLSDLVKWMQADGPLGPTIVQELVVEIRVEREQRLGKALDALDDERVRACLVDGRPMPYAKYSELNLLEHCVLLLKHSELNLLEHCVLLLKHSSWSYRLEAISRIESAVARVATDARSGDES